MYTELLNQSVIMTTSCIVTMVTRMLNAPFDRPGNLEAVHVEESMVAKVGLGELEAELKILLLWLWQRKHCS